MIYYNAKLDRIGFKIKNYDLVKIDEKNNFYMALTVDWEFVCEL